MPDETRPAPDDVAPPLRSRLSRRFLLTTSGAALATTGLAAIGTAVTHEALAQQAPATPAAMAGDHAAADATQPLRFFNLHEAQTVEALTARILPGSADDPGAREAGVTDYIDRALGGPNLGYDLKTYLQGPFLVLSDEPVTVEASSQPDIYRSVPVAAADASRYGYQSVMTPQEMYRRGLGFVDAYATAKSGKAFADLAEAEQDAVLTDIAADKATGFDGPSGKAFFTQLRNDTIEGMFSDPMYGGNRGMVGWALLGFPGAQHYYSAKDLQATDFSRPPASLADMVAAEH